VRKSTGVVIGAAAAVLAVAVGGAALVRDGATGRRPDRIDGDGPWRVVRQAFEVKSEWMGGPQVIVADPEACFTGFGRDGLSTAYWVGEGECTTARVVSPKPFTGGDSLPSEDRNSIMTAVPARNGGYLALTRHTYHGDAYAYSTAVLHGDGTPDGWRTVARFEAGENEDSKASHIGPQSLAVTKNGYVAVGRHNERALAWLSDYGTTWRPVNLPPAEGASSTSVTSVAAAPDGRLVAMGTSARPNEPYTLKSWVSKDGGRTWRHGTVPDIGGSPQVHALLHDGKRFVALGGTDGDIRGPALVLTSTDGRTWQQDDAGTDTRMITAATVVPGEGLLAVSSTGEERESDESGGTRECASAWLATRDGTWTGVDLGCHGVPTSLAVLADGRVAAVHWTTLFLRKT